MIRCVSLGDTSHGVLRSGLIFDFQTPIDTTMGMTKVFVSIMMTLSLLAGLSHASGDNHSDSEQSLQTRGAIELHVGDCSHSAPMHDQSSNPSSRHACCHHLPAFDVPTPLFVLRTDLNQRHRLFVVLKPTFDLLNHGPSPVL